MTTVGGRGDRGVSPVVGVVVLVAIVVVLAATISVFALQFGDRGQEPAPSVAMTAQYDEQTTPNGQYFHLTVRSGDRIETRQLSLQLRGAVDATGTPVSVDESVDPLATQAGSVLEAGETISIGANQVTPQPASGGYLDLGDARILLVWNPQEPDREESAIIWRWEPTR
ncbi:type IV pilin [Halomicrobium mukohataei]|uniref:Type IV pilin n=1 Tax=Halomicrobium mukohataei TaxID=57705 RepID=A0A847UBT4_9EURY|nr:type IV pilin [Halomicrobium mukohataei]NLV08910.1 type IV pilin [Halomicrobium mukohataei]